jgi:S-formylglutathione hydrolase FrmB
MHLSSTRGAARGLVAVGLVAVGLVAVGLVAGGLLAGCGSGAGTTGPGPTSSASTVPSGSADDESPACVLTTLGTAYRLETCHIPSPSLADNLLGDPAVLNAFILTPAGYEDSSVRYPAVYHLAGYTDDAIGTAAILPWSGPESAPAGKALPIVVILSGRNAFDGGMYANSSVSGNWEDAVTVDLVGYVDAHYRTIAAPASRGISGHSMGGAGAINIAMHHPDIFGALYAISPAIFDTVDARNILGENLASRILDIEDQMAAVAPADRGSRLKDAVAADGNAAFTFAYGTAFAPDPNSPILMDFPYKRVDGSLVLDEAVLAKWNAGWGDLQGKVDQYESALRRYRAIGVDYGTADEIPFIPGGSHQFVSLLQEAGIGVVEVTFAGGHTDQFGDRFLNHMLPFMVENLAAS